MNDKIKESKKVIYTVGHSNIRAADSAYFQTGISRLMKGVDAYRIVLMCSEEDPANCHRRLLIGRVLKEQGIEILHIRKEGIVQSEKDMAGIQFQPDLFGKQDVPLWRSSKPVLYKTKKLVKK